MNVKFHPRTELLCVMSKTFGSSVFVSRSRNRNN